jgi:hypothetical protein
VRRLAILADVKSIRRRLLNSADLGSVIFPPTASVGDAADQSVRCQTLPVAEPIICPSPETLPQPGIELPPGNYCGFQREDFLTEE